MTWTPSHSGIKGIEIADKLCHATTIGNTKTPTTEDNIRRRTKKNLTGEMIYYQWYPPDLWRQESVKRKSNKINRNTNLLMFKYINIPSSTRQKSRHPIWHTTHSQKNQYEWRGKTYGMTHTSEIYPGLQKPSRKFLVSTCQENNGLP